MASIRERRSTAGDTSYAVLYRLDGKQSSLPFETANAALLNRTGKAGMAEVQRHLGHESITTRSTSTAG
jgi:hypothetical protein